jgi:hypothetical protein
MPDIDIDSYLLMSDAKVVAEGVLRKKSRDLKLWKSRQYAIRSDGVLVTIHPTKNVATDIFNLAYVIIKKSSIENLDDSGSTDFSTTCGVPVVLDAVNSSNVDIVFDSKDEAEEFCFAAVTSSIAVDISVRQNSFARHRMAICDMSCSQDFAQEMNWTRILECINHKPVTKELSVLLGGRGGNATVLQSSKFIKRSECSKRITVTYFSGAETIHAGSLRRKDTWKTRDYELRYGAVLSRLLSRCSS